MKATRLFALRCSLIGAILGSTVLMAPLVQAAANEQDRVAAQALFEQGKELITAGRHAEACAKFDESQRLDPGIGTQFNLADCYERVGRFASAYALYVDVAARSKTAGQAQREAVARERAAALKPKLTRLVIVIPEEVKVTGLEVQRDGASVGSAQWGLPIPVDPGLHKVLVKAPGKQSWEGSIEVPNDAQQHALSVPRLLAAPQQSATNTADSSSPRDSEIGAWPLQKTLGLVAGGIGVVGLGVGGFFGLRAINKNKDSKPYCDDGGNCIEPGFGYREDARSAGNIATVGFAVGAVGLIGGAVLFFTAPSGESAGQSAQKRNGSALRVLPSVDRDRADLIVMGSF
jgi:serine/threonine-protein kinase